MMSCDNSQVKCLAFKKLHEVLNTRRKWSMEDIFFQMIKEACKCINSSADDNDVCTFVRNMIISKKTSKHFDLKHVDAMESSVEPANLNSTLVNGPCHRVNF